MAKKILLGGSPCTFWSIAQKNNRETEAQGLGWELFKNFLIARDKFKPDIFLYENNKSVSQAIKDQIAKELGVGTDPMARFTYINSALVSAQNRQRFYVTNFGDIEQPEDRGVLLRDILETGTTDRDKARAVIGSIGRTTTREYFQKQQGTMAFAPVRVGDLPNSDGNITKSQGRRIYSCEGKSVCISAGASGGNTDRNSSSTGLYAISLKPTDCKCGENFFSENGEETHRPQTGEPIRVGSLPRPNGELSTSQAMRVYGVEGKSVNLTSQGGGLGAKTGLYAIPVCHSIPQQVRVRKYSCDISEFQNLLREGKKKSKITNKQIAENLQRPQTEVEHWFRTDKHFNVPDAEVWFDLKKMLGITTVAFDDFVTVFETREGVFEKADRCYDVSGKMSTLMTGKSDNIITPLCFAYPCEWDESGKPIKAVSGTNSKIYTVYEVKNGYITINEKSYPVKLQDGYYIIRKLTPIECERLQTLPDNYTSAVSDTQRYKGLGNGWTAEVIIHILNHALKDVPRDEEIIVLSMYDGIGTGRYCLDKMGFTNVKYFAYEKDKYAMQMAMSNYPDIIQMGDAFGVRHPDWTIGY